jgi:hypothetical protein
MIAASFPHRRNQMRPITGVVRSAIAIALYVVLAVVLSRAAMLLTANLALDAAHVISAASAFGVALWQRARIATYVMAVVLVAFGAELAVHAYFGIHSVQGAASHLAVLLAAMCGVVLTVLIGRLDPSAGSPGVA